MNVRQALVDALTPELPTYRLLGYPLDLDAVTRPTVMLWQSRVERLEQIELDRLLVTVELWVVTGSEDPSKADDLLDDSLSDVIEALHPITWINWTTAERGVLHDRFHGYRITAQAVAKIGE